MSHTQQAVAGVARAEQAPVAAPAALDETRFNDLYRRVARPLWAYLRRLTGSAALADDLMQEAFTRLLVQAAPPEGEPAQRAWLFRVATNLAIDGQRRGKREVPEAEMTEPAAPASVEASRDPLLSKEMGRAFGELEVKDRALLWLAYVEDASHRDIGARARREGIERARAAVPRAQEAGGHLDPPAGAGTMTRPSLRTGSPRAGRVADRPGRPGRAVAPGRLRVVPRGSRNR